MDKIGQNFVRWGRPGPLAPPPKSIPALMDCLWFLYDTKTNISDNCMCKNISLNYKIAVFCFVSKDCIWNEIHRNFYNFKHQSILQNDANLFPYFDEASALHPHQGQEYKADDKYMMQYFIMYTVNNKSNIRTKMHEKSWQTANKPRLLYSFFLRFPCPFSRSL